MQPEVRHVLDFAVLYERALDELERTEVAEDEARRRHDTQGQRISRSRVSQRRRDLERARGELGRAQANLEAELERAH